VVYYVRKTIHQTGGIKMTYQIARTLTRILSGTVLLIIYLVQVTSRYQGGVLTMDQLQSLGQLMLVFIGIGIGVTIAVEIVFHILYSIGIAVKASVKTGSCNDKDIENDIEKTIEQEFVEDEMAKLIDLKSLRVGYVTSGIGFVASLIVLALGNPVFIVLNILFVSFFIAGIIESFARIFYYKRGI